MDQISEAPDLRLVVITDRTLAAPRDLLHVVRLALEAGAPAIQLREKDATARELYELAIRLRALTSEYEALLFINDRLDIALTSGADGVHLGPQDIPLEAARRAAPGPFLIGVSIDDPAMARRAEAAGADYIGCGAVFGSTTKRSVQDEWLGPEGLAAVAGAVSIPVVGIGGIDTENVHDLANTGAAGFATISAVMGADDPRAAVKAMIGSERIEIGW